jgi:adenylate cyclase
MARTESTVARAEIARQNEEVVLAEAALRGSRTVAWARLATFFLTSAAMGLIPRALGRPEIGHQRDPPMAAALVVYLLFTVGAVVGTHLAQPRSARRAIRAGLTLLLLDFSFMAFMGIRSFQVGHGAHPQIGAAAFAAVLCFTVASYHWSQVVVGTVLACAGYLLVDVYVGTYDLSPTLFVVGIYCAMGLLFTLTNRRVRTMFLELRRRDNLTRFLAPEIASEVMRLGGAPLKPTEREVTVLFSDIRNFTGLCETLPPEAVLRFLDDYFGHMTQLVKAHAGIVNKFLGDGMLAFWNVPERNPEHAAAAVRAALDMRKVLRELNDARAAVGAPPIAIGVGIHTGKVAAGMLGGADQHEYTVIGDAVNVASRVEGLTKQHGVDLLVSESTWALIQDRFAGERVGQEHVKGRAEPVVVYAVRDAAPGMRQDPALAAATAAGAER